MRFWIVNILVFGISARSLLFGQAVPVVQRLVVDGEVVELQFRVMNDELRQRFGMTERDFQALLAGRVSQEARLRSQIDQTCRTYQLAGQYKQKLRIAGRADILSFLEQVRQLRDSCYNPNLSEADLHDILTQFRQLRAVASNRPFRADNSLYVKVLNRILATEQIVPQDIVFLDDVAAIEAIQQVKYYESLVSFVGGSLAHEAPLRDQKQRIQLAEMLRQNLQTGPEIPLENPMQAWQRLAAIPAEQWMKTLDESQWKALNQKFKNETR